MCFDFATCLLVRWHCHHPSETLGSNSNFLCIDHKNVPSTREKEKEMGDKWRLGHDEALKITLGIRLLIHGDLAVGHVDMVPRQPIYIVCGG